MQGDLSNGGQDCSAGQASLEDSEPDDIFSLVVCLSAFKFHAYYVVLTTAATGSHVEITEGVKRIVLCIDETESNAPTVL